MTETMPKIVPVFKPEDREFGGVNPATCRHDWRKNTCFGYDYWCRFCLIPGKPETKKDEAKCGQPS